MLLSHKKCGIMLIKIDFSWPNTDIGWKIPNGRLLFLAMLNITSVFSSSDLLIAFMISVLLVWHVQHKSVRGLQMTIKGTNCFQYLQNVA